MPGWHGEAPGRRLGVTVVLAVVLGVAGLVAGLTLLLPDPVDVSVLPPLLPDHVNPTSSCEEPQTSRSPVPVRSGVILACPELFDGRFVVIEGEAIGDTFSGPDGRLWVLVNDDDYARLGPLSGHGAPAGTNSGLAVLLPVGQEPVALGGPGVVGDLLRVVGTFQTASQADQGGPAVIAEAVITRRIGVEVGHARSARLAVATGVAVLLTTVLVTLAVILRRRRLLA